MPARTAAAAAAAVVVAAAAAALHLPVQVSEALARAHQARQVVQAQGVGHLEI